MSSFGTWFHNLSNELHYPLDEPVLRTMKNPIGMLFGHVRDNHHTAHQGWDLFADQDPVLALSGGRVMWQHPWGGSKDDKYGNCLLVDFKRRDVTYYAFYAHLEKILVKDHDKVERGQALGISGTTGNGDSKSPHLHFEVRTTCHRVGKGLTGRLDPGQFFPELATLPVQQHCFI